MAKHRASMAAILGVIVLTAMILHVMGRTPLCTCGDIRLWAGDVHSPDNSQQIADWYSPSHVIHGFLFFLVLQWLLPRVTAGWRLAIAVALESGWEILENSPLIIERYRQATIAIGYTGDSILNSVSDIAMMTAGFLLAGRLGTLRTLLLALALELLTLAVIRDNLTLNILMLAWPVDAIRVWQAGA
jgi:uncharacterized membrane protein YjdF